MRLLISFFFLLLILNSYAQEDLLKNWTPIVIDKKTKEPIPDATISINRIDYYPTSENGFAEIPFVKITKNDSIYVSFLGYTTLKLSVDNVKELPSKLMLEEKIAQLAEVVISSKSNKKVTLGSNPSAKVSHFLISINTKYALYINNNKKYNGYISEILVRMHNFTGAMKMPFKLELFDKSTISKYPNKSLMDEVITQNLKKQKWFKLDISHLNIKIPKNGFFVVFSTLPQDYYSHKKYYSGSGFITDKVPGLDLTIENKYINKENYCLVKTNYPEWQMQEKIEYQMQAVLQILNETQ